MRRIQTLTLFVIISLIGTFAIQAQDAVPTLVSPTLVPTVPAGVTDQLLSESVLGRVQRDGVLRVGMLYNDPPFGELNIQGNHTGFDADLARSIANVWSVEIEFHQVTRQNWLDALQRGAVDLIIAARVHRREWDDVVEFSQSYRVSSQSMMVRAEFNDQGEPITPMLINMAGRPVGYVVGTASEVALREWQARSGIVVDAQPYLLIDQAIRALFAGEVDGVVARKEHLVRSTADYLDAITILPEPIQLEPFAIVLPRQDAVARLFVNRTLQYLLEQGTLEELHTQYFPGEPFNFDVMPVWNNIGDEPPSLGQVNPTISYPQQYAAPRILNEKVLRVAGMPQITDDMSEGLRRVAQVQRGILDQFAERWGVRLEFVEGDPVQLIASGQAEIALGLPLDWNLAGQVDFSQPFLMHGDRMMAPIRRDIGGFNELRGRWIAVIRDDAGAEERAQGWADSINANVRFLQIFEGNAATTILEDPPNADVVYADSLKLIPHLQANPDELELTDRWYSRNYLAFAVPHNDLDFRRLVNYTLQEMVEDGSLGTLLTSVIPPGSEPPQFDIWPGSDQYLGLTLSR